MREYKCENEKSKEFEKEIEAYNTNLNVFIKLFNMWSQMTTDERGKCIDKLLWK